MTTISASQPMQPPRVGPAPAAQQPAALVDPIRVLQQYYPWLAASAVFGTILGTIVHFALLFIYPLYTGYVVFECKPPFRVGEGSREIGGSFGVKEELQLYMETQVSVMKSDIVLSRAVNEPQVRETKWAQSFNSGGNYDPAEALRELRKVVSSYVIPETSLVRLQVRVHERTDSATIANAIKDVYLKDNQTQTNRETTSLLTLTNEKVKELDSDIRTIQNSMENLLNTREMTSLEQQNTAYYVEVQNLQPQLVSLLDSLSKATQQKETFDTLAKNPGGIVYPEQVREDAEKSRMMEDLKSQIAQIQARMESDKQEFGPEHSNVKRGMRYIESLEAEKSKQLEREMAKLFAANRDQLDNTVKNLEAASKALQAKLDRAKQQLTDTTVAIKQYKEFERTLEAKQTLKANFEERAVELALVQQRGTRVRPITDAEPPDTPSFPRPQIMIPLVAVLVVVLTAGFIVLKEAREQRIRSPQDVAVIPRTRPIGFVPELGMDPTSPPKCETASIDRPEGIVAESYRQIRNNVLKACQNKGFRTVLVSSGLPGSGASSLVSNVAAAVAGLDMRVLVIDANVRRPSQHTIFGVQEGPGLAEVLRGGTPMAGAVVATKVANLSILPAGKDRKGVHERLGTAVMGGVLNEAREKFDLVLIDSAPAVVAGDAAAMAGITDSVVLVVRAFSEKRGLVARLRGQLGDQKAEFLGVVVNAVQASAGGYFKKNFEQSIEYQRMGADAPAPADKKA